MPYKSEKQRRFMYARHPNIAKRWEQEGKNVVVKSSRKEAIKRRMKTNKV